MPETLGSNPEVPEPTESALTTQAEKQQLLMLQEIEAARPQAEWTVEVPEKQYGVVIRLPHGCWISATLNYLDESHRTAELYIDMFNVNNQLQDKGVGTRLMKSLIAEAKKYGASKLAGHVTSLSALKTRARIFGPENLSFYNHITKEPLKLSFDQLLAMAKEEGPSYDIHVDLTKIDTTNWEEAVSP